MEKNQIHLERKPLISIIRKRSYRKTAFTQEIIDVQ